MTKDTEKIIEGYPDISIADARLIFIRNTGRNDYTNRSANFQSLIGTPTPIKNADRESVVSYIGFLDTMIKELKAYQQGLEMEYSKEVQPEIEANHRAAIATKDAKKSQPKTLEGMIGKLGMNKEDLLAALKKQLGK